MQTETDEWQRPSKAEMEAALAAKHARFEQDASPADKFSNQLLQDWPDCDVMGDRRLPTLHKFAAAMEGMGFSRQDILNSTEHANMVLCVPELPPEQVWLALTMATNTPLSAEAIQNLMPPPPPPLPAEVNYVKAPVIIEPTDSGKPQTKVELHAPCDIDAGEILTTNYLVKYWVGRAVLAEMGGEWNAGKTFLALDLGVHVAAGQEWFGNRVRQGGVIFVGYEGEHSMVKRIEALKREHPDWDWNRIPFRWYNFRWPIVNPNSAKCKGREMLEEVLGQFWFETGSHPALIIIDPLRDALGGSDSDPAYTAAYLTLMRQIRDTIGATVLTLHHPGHGDKTRGRGDSGIDAAMDSVLWVAKEKGPNPRGQISATKQRDDAKGNMYYQLKIVELGQDDEGDSVKTCVAEQTDAPPIPLTGDQATAYAALTGDDSLNPVTGGSITEAAARAACKAAGIRGNHVTRALAALDARKLIQWDHARGIIEFRGLSSFLDDDAELDQIGPK